MDPRALYIVVIVIVSLAIFSSSSRREGLSADPTLALAEVLQPSKTISELKTGILEWIKLFSDTTGLSDTDAQTISKLKTDAEKAYEALDGLLKSSEQAANLQTIMAANASVTLTNDKISQLSTELTQMVDILVQIMNQTPNAAKDAVLIDQMIALQSMVQFNLQDMTKVQSALTAFRKYVTDKNVAQLLATSTTINGMLQGFIDRSVNAKDIHQKMTNRINTLIGNPTVILSDKPVSSTAAAPATQVPAVVVSPAVQVPATQVPAAATVSTGSNPTVKIVDTTLIDALRTSLATAKYTLSNPSTVAEMQKLASDYMNMQNKVNQATQVSAGLIQDIINNIPNQSQIQLYNRALSAFKGMYTTIMSMDIAFVSSNAQIAWTVVDGKTPQECAAYARGKKALSRFVNQTCSIATPFPDAKGLTSYIYDRVSNRFSQPYDTLIGGDPPAGSMSTPYRATKDKSLADCKNYCMSLAECTGISWNTQNPQSPICDAHNYVINNSAHANVPLYAVVADMRGSTQETKPKVDWVSSLPTLGLV
jgi:hypothetical protein